MQSLMKKENKQQNNKKFTCKKKTKNRNKYLQSLLAKNTSYN